MPGWQRRAGTERTLARALELEGYAVVAVDDGVQALPRARREVVDALVLDVVMPGLDGLGVCRVLRADGDRGCRGGASGWLPLRPTCWRTRCSTRWAAAAVGADRGGCWRGSASPSSGARR